MKEIWRKITHPRPKREVTLEDIEDDLRAYFAREKRSPMQISPELGEQINELSTTMVQGALAEGITEAEILEKIRSFGNASLKEIDFSAQTIIDPVDLPQEG